tara:strand:- start:1441 stop:2100 length:660 start_codon:yes stop_codon:yes gene_type:complete
MNDLLINYKQKIKNLEKVTGKSIYKDLENEKDEINFFSKLSEIKIGSYLLDKSFDDLTYEPKIEGKRPDWQVNKNGDKIIIEVLKINLPNEKFTKKIESFKRGEYYIPPSGLYMGLAMLNKNDKDKIEIKEMKYRELIKRKEYKLMIGIDASEWDKRIDAQDIMDTFNFENMKSNESDFIKNVTGLILIPYMGNTEFILNKNCENQLCNENLLIMTRSC